jgi:hypothetical protein
MSMGKLIGMGRRSCRLCDGIRRFVSSLLVERHNNRDLRAGTTVDSGAMRHLQSALVSPPTIQ